MLRKSLLTLLISALAMPAMQAVAAEELVVYSARKEHLIKPLFDAYTEKTGVEIKYTTAKAGALFEKLKAEGSNSPADLFITVDAGNLWQAADAGLLQQVDSEVLEKNIPENLQDPENRWFGLSVRARTIVYNTETTSPDQLSSYKDLADPKWKNQLILRTSKKVYNQSLVASLIAQYGAEEAEKIVTGWVNNLSVAPFSNDTKSMEAVAAGLGQATVVNTYYFGRLMKKKPDLPLALFWPGQDSDSTGVHMNISGAGVTTHAGNAEEAVALLEWLSGAEAQAVFASLNMEYPANPAVAPDALVASWGEFKGNPMNVAVYGKLQGDAIKLMDRAGYK